MTYALERVSSFNLGLNTAKNTDHIKKTLSNKNFSEWNFLQKNSMDAYLYLSQEWN